MMNNYIACKHQYLLTTSTLSAAAAGGTHPPPVQVLKCKRIGKLINDDSTHIGVGP
jgi:hypothetical protein